jgi:hypothetical protein
VDERGLADGAGALYVRLGLEKLREPRLPELIPPPALAQTSSGISAVRTPKTKPTPTTFTLKLRMRFSSFSRSLKSGRSCFDAHGPEILNDARYSVGLWPVSSPLDTGMRRHGGRGNV